MYAVMRASDMVLLLISDAAQADQYQQIFAALRPGATLGLSHGFLLQHLDNEGAWFPDHINVVAVCPKGMGLSVRRLYIQGKALNGASINASFAVVQDVDGKATDQAIGWSIALGAPCTLRMWQVGEQVRAKRVEGNIPLHPETAGLYCAAIAVDSLNPYMHARGVAYVVDNCSTTARLGARKWGPRFDHLILQEVFPAYDLQERLCA